VPRSPTAATAARARSVAYAFFSRLLQSPFDPALAGEGPIPRDAPAALADLGPQLPGGTDLGALADEAARGLEEGTDAFAREYGALLEIGSDGPPLPIREELAFPDAEGQRRKQEVVRFYEHFGYALLPERQWAPDHLSVELEFLHYVSFREAESRSDADATAFLLAQRDFLERHTAAWVPRLRGALLARARDRYLRTLIASLADFLARDLEWLNEQLGGGGEEAA
jgi:DMSO reductase family type II enzyme chaperone